MLTARVEMAARVERAARAKVLAIDAPIRGAVVCSVARGAYPLCRVGYSTE